MSILPGFGCPDKVLSVFSPMDRKGICEAGRGEVSYGPIFPFEMTLVQATFRGCGTTNPLGATAAYMHGMGTVVRCPVCDTALIRIAHAKGRYWLDNAGRARPSDQRGGIALLRKKRASPRTS
jgi:hypothetical protein